METITLLQHYWWLIISLLGALLVFLLFVQGGQGLLYCLGRTEEERNMLVNSLGRKWEFTFTTLVTFGGAFFASFPLFYSTSFGGAYYVWMTILLSFVIQPVAYQFRRKAGNVFGEKTFDVFLTINGIAGPLLLGSSRVQTSRWTASTWPTAQAAAAQRSSRSGPRRGTVSKRSETCATWRWGWP